MISLLSDITLRCLLKMLLELFSDYVNVTSKLNSYGDSTIDETKAYV